MHVTNTTDVLRNRDESKQIREDIRGKGQLSESSGVTTTKVASSEIEAEIV